MEAGTEAEHRPATFLADPCGNGFDAWLPHLDMTGTVDADGLVVRGPLLAPIWETSIHVLGVGRTESRITPWLSKGRSVGSSRVCMEGADFSVEYLLSEEGLRQNFLVLEAPLGDGALLIHLELNTLLYPEQEDDHGIVFRNERGTVCHAYRDLKVWDACGKPLSACMELVSNGQGIRIQVEDGDAVYPVTVDPVSTTADRILNPPVAGGYFGWSTANAGDVNGDGYSDVIVGAYDAANGQVTEGLVYVYYGSPTGIPAAPSVTLEVDQVDANFGFSVDGAGDVNGDGFSDVIVGASTWESTGSQDKEGAVFIFHGSAGGLSTVPNTIIEANAANNYMGSSVAGLGDINGDGYSDVGMGGFLAAGEGIAWVALGSATGINPVWRHRLSRGQGGAQFGIQIAPAGDVNGDGFNDVIVGAHKYNLFAPLDGAVFIYHGSANALGVGLNPAPTTTFNTNGYSLRNGWSVSTAGDVNGDGYSDIIIGDWQDNIGPEVYEGVAFVYHGSAAGIVTVPVTIIQSDQDNAHLGRNVSTAGDVNGDGYADVIIGAPEYSNGHTQEGAAFLHLGSPTGISSSPYRIFDSNLLSGQIAESVSTAGDVNGDGYSDMIVGNGRTSGGPVRIYHGGPSSVRSTPSFSRSSGSAAARLGASVANAGDVNGDGYSDALFGAPDATNGQAGEGQVYVHYGGLLGLNPLPSLILEANLAGAGYGTSVASAGDVNGDGYSDVVIGSPNANGTGRAYIHHGGPAGLGFGAALTLNGTPGSLFGASVCTAGDVNADGYADVLIGAPAADRVELHLGSATGLDPTPHVTFAPIITGGGYGTSVSTAGDVNGDGYSDVIIGAPEYTNPQVFEGAAFIYLGNLTQVLNTPQLTLELNLPGRRVGQSVAGAGDMTGDGYYEVIVGAPTTTQGETEEGVAYVLRGSPAGSTGAGIMTIQSNQVGAHLGTSVAEAGDVNGDGYADVIVGAPDYSNGQVNEGAAWVVLGASTGMGTSMVIEVNGTGEHFGTAVSGSGDVDGDGYSDVLCGAPNASPSVANEGRVHLFRGNDALSYNRLSRQYLADLVSPLSTNSDDFSNTIMFGVGHRARSSIQRTTAKLRWEVVHEGQPFSGAPITTSVAADANSAAWTDLGLAGVEIKELLPKLAPYLRHKWRVRVEYPMHKMIDGQRFSRWFYGYASAVGDIGILPIELLSFEGRPVRDGNQLTWITGSELMSDRFDVERSLDGEAFTLLGTVAAAGRSNQPLEYEFVDTEPPTGIAYYRLRMVDTDGSEEFSNTVVVMRKGGNMLVFPVPVDDVLNWSVPDVEVRTVIIRDALGRQVLTATPTTSGIRSAALQRLATGTYSIFLLDQAGAIIGRSRFVKR